MKLASHAQNPDIFPINVWIISFGLGPETFICRFVTFYCFLMQRKRIATFWPSYIAQRSNTAHVAG